MSAPVHLGNCSVSELFLMGLIDTNDVLPDGNVTTSARVAAEQVYAEHMHRRPHTAPILPTTPRQHSTVPRAPRPQRTQTPRHISTHAHHVASGTQHSNAVSPRQLSITAPTPPAIKCCVCVDTPSQYACVPCFHLCLCASCMPRVKQRCPLCRAHVSRMQRIYT